MNENRGFMEDVSRKIGSQRSKSQRLRKKFKAVMYLGGECSHCGYDKCHAAFDFHHLDPSKKMFSISLGVKHKYAWARMQPELDKCLLLCANCHRELHFNQ